VPSGPPARSTDSWGPTAAIFSPRFDHVEWEDTLGTLVVPDAQPVVDYVASMRSWLEHIVPSSWDEYLAHVSAVCRERIAADGNVSISTHAGVFVCR
jgi:hypothetical protein